MSVASAMTIGLAFAVGMSLITGILIAYAEIPSLFATLAMATFVYGFGRAHLITGTDVVYCRRISAGLRNSGRGM
jgi:monosaccharide ABC transporter membrane protein, CUT2 family (TC 3.A.1.2.-)